MHPYKQQKAFSMLTAIVIIVLMSTVAMFVMSLSGKLVKETTAQYQREQAVLLANSYTEYAIMSVTANDRTSNCLRRIRGTINGVDGYSADIFISYIGTDAQIGSCTGVSKLGIVPAGSDTPLTIIVDAYIRYGDLENDISANKEITYHRRTVQKI
ncbi:MAG: type II secretion system protein [Sulfurovum sp.]|nr:type II secretion system protein [Sulfurovum sp.]